MSNSQTGIDPANDLERSAYNMGYQDGRATGTWIVDGNTTEATARNLLRGIEEGDPVVMDLIPCPLSGEWADDLTPQDIFDDVGVDNRDGDFDYLLDAYECGYVDGWVDEVRRSAERKIS